MEFLVLYMIQGAIIGAFCAYLASQKGRGGGAWFFLGLFFSILALLVLIGLPSEQRTSDESRRHHTRSPSLPVPERSVSRQTLDVRLCPHCIQEVHELAAACPHCQRDLPELERCSETGCRKIINPTDDRCEDDEGHPYCGSSHREREARRQARSNSPPVERWRPKAMVKCSKCGVEVYENIMPSHSKTHR